MQLELSPEERELLERIVDRELSEMRVAVRRTSTPRFHDDLASQEVQLRELLTRIRALGGGGS